MQAFWYKNVISEQEVHKTGVSLQEIQLISQD